MLLCCDECNLTFCVLLPALICPYGQAPVVHTMARWGILLLPVSCSTLAIAPSKQKTHAPRVACAQRVDSMTIKTLHCHSPTTRPRITLLYCWNHGNHSETITSYRFLQMSDVWIQSALYFYAPRVVWAQQIDSVTNGTVQGFFRKKTDKFFLFLLGNNVCRCSI